jgi:hypothetical protein
MIAKGYRLKFTKRIYHECFGNTMHIRVISVLLGFVTIGTFWGSLIYFGFNWLFAAGIYFFADREVTAGGLFTALLLGFIGAIIWVIVDMNRTRNRIVRHPSPLGKGTHYLSTLGEEYKCRNCR